MSSKQSCLLCDNPAQVSELCNSCYHALYYWRNKTPTQMVHRMRKLDLYKRRMEFRLGGNVTTAPSTQPASKKKAAKKRGSKKGAA